MEDQTIPPSEEELRREKATQYTDLAVTSLEKLSRLEPTRELSLAITKAEESVHWLTSHLAKVHQ